MLQRLFQRYTGFLRSLKLVYVLNNLFQYSRLKPNKTWYKRYGVKKSVVAPIGAADFPDNETERPWLDQPDALSALDHHERFQSLGPKYQKKARQFIGEGYCVLEGFFSQDETDQLNREMDRLIASGKSGFNYTGRKLFNIHEQSALAKERFLKNPELVSFMEFLLGSELIPFQTLGFIQGSEQRAHSDSIHMTTAPMGYLIAAWIALEDCTDENGALFYYPGSHRMPYVMTSDYPSGNTFFTIGAESNKRYEEAIAARLEGQPFEKRDFLAKRGDVLIWHANLLHGGNPIRREGATRRSLVCHYYGKNAFCFHEISQRPALLPLG
jgi:hypothetical protein